MTIGLEPDRFAYLGFRRDEVVLAIGQCGGEFGVRASEIGLESDGTPKLFDRGVDLAQALNCQPQTHVKIGIFRPDPNRPS